MRTTHGSIHPAIPVRYLPAATPGSAAGRVKSDWSLFPREMVRFGQQDALSYLLYLVGGCVVAFHLDQVHAWVCAHARLVVALTAAAALAAEGIYFLAAHGVITVLGSGSDPFQLSVSRRVICDPTGLGTYHHNVPW